ncbi:MAG: methylated-DNA--[protein]-cysteine S-methyltransferase [Chromatiales bacterium]|nr:methylated-DNA--[protein]-cysteine S-methyltransferase [Chromatiales bacterium]
MSHLYISQVQTPIVVGSGATVWLDLLWNERGISSINFSSQKNPQAVNILPKKWHDLFERYWNRSSEDVAHNELINLPIDLVGTIYQQRVWDELQKIPLGKTVSYGLISEKLKSSPRAVATACKANPVVLAVPCHRVVSKSGVGGFMGAVEGDEIDIKKWLIKHEQ